MQNEFTEFSFEKIEELTGNDPQAVKHFSELFISHTIGKDLPKLVAAVEGNEMKEAGEIAHRMKASIDLFSITEGGERIRTIEGACQYPDGKARATNEIIQLQEILDRVKTSIEGSIL
ncbi:hypothetical protein [Sanyastnella coralliicola]|uniref:hypothetical protein n=1 Tax=Sanyastnella coralliicola TaxID=3069118 RepID=UPI0027BA028D|nr:hypothetical protein [Longitalea sp. SCSIO 12813]